VRTLICSTFSAYDLPGVDGLCAHEQAEVAGATLWLIKRRGEARGGQSTKQGEAR
jgi:hypothetical protein